VVRTCPTPCASIRPRPSW